MREDRSQLSSVPSIPRSYSGQYVVTLCIEGCTQVEEDEDVKGTGVSESEELIECFKGCRFCAVEWMKTETGWFHIGYCSAGGFGVCVATRRSICSIPIL